MHPFAKPFLVSQNTWDFLRIIMRLYLLFNVTLQGFTHPIIWAAPSNSGTICILPFSLMNFCKNLTWFCKATQEAVSIDPITGCNEITFCVVFMKSPLASQSFLLLLEVLQIEVALSTIWSLNKKTVMRPYLYNSLDLFQNY